MLTIRINNQITIEEEATSLSLLETMEKNGLIVESHCRNGDCGTCRCTLLSGEVEYTTAPLAFINHNEILPCVCKPTSDLNIIGISFQMMKKNEAI